MANLGRAILESLVDASEFFDTLGQLDCGQTFAWPADAGEAEYYRRRNWVAPRRCELCRLTRRSTTAVHAAIHEVT